MKKTTVPGRVLVAMVGIILAAGTVKADLVARYVFDDGTANDFSGNGYNGEVLHARTRTIFNRISRSAGINIRRRGSVTIR